MSSISSELYVQVRQAILACGPVQSQQELRAVFADPRLLLWRDFVPEAQSAVTRTEMLIAYLQSRNNSQGQNALVLFLRVSGDRVSPEDVCYQKLHECADKLTISDPGKEPNDKAIQVFEVLTKRFSLEELRTLCFYLEVNFDELPGETLSAKARELITYLHHRKQMTSLQNAIQHLHPDIDFK